MKQRIHNRKSQTSKHEADSKLLLKRNNILKVSAAVTAIMFSVSATVPSIASEDPAPKEANSIVQDGKAGQAESAASTDLMTQKVNEQAQSCADPANVDGLAHSQMNTISDLKKMIMTTVNTDKIFNAANEGGCFDALKDFPNLSGSIPSLTGIATALKQTLINYATRKVCNAVNDALSELVEPLNEVLDDISRNGQIDLTGALNKKMYEELYKIDPELGRVATPVTTEIKWKASDIVDEFNTDNVDVQYIQNQTSPASDQSSSTTEANTGSVTNPPVTESTTSEPPKSTINGMIEEPKKSILESAKSVISSIF